ncbi:MAG: hypothetical protein Q4D71_08965 [Oscillospiraceae bacterium]|nr:hypothetical protein [Oscillospiraceae bacterium]
MNIMQQAAADTEIKELKDYIRKRTGKAPGLLYWDGESIEEYKERLRRTQKELMNSE